MLETAIINLKKTHGGGQSNFDELKDAVENYGKLTKEEIDIIDPHLIICGGTFDFAKQLFCSDDTDDFDVKLLPSGEHYFIVKKRVYLEFVHPCWFNVHRKILFAYAKSVFREIMGVVKAQKA